MLQNYPFGVTIPRTVHEKIAFRIKKGTVSSSIPLVGSFISLELFSTNCKDLLSNYTSKYTIKNKIAMHTIT